MIGFPGEFPFYVFGNDNKSVLSNSNLFHLVLKKKSCLVAYHYVCERMASNLWIIEYVKSEDTIVGLPLKTNSRRIKNREINPNDSSPY